MHMDMDDATRLRRAITRAARRFNVAATDEGLSPSQSSVLAVIASRGPIGLSELAEAEHINSTMLSRVIGVLERAKLIRRTPEPGDLRASRVSATATGRSTHNRIKAQRAQLVASATEVLTESEMNLLMSAIPVLEILAEQLRTPELDAIGER